MGLVRWVRDLGGGDGNVTGWLPFTPWNASWDVAAWGGYGPLSARRIGKLVQVHGVLVSVNRWILPDWRGAYLPAGIPAPTYRVPLLVTQMPPYPEVGIQVAHGAFGHTSLGTHEGEHRDQVCFDEQIGTEATGTTYRILIHGSYLLP